VLKNSPRGKHAAKALFMMNSREPDYGDVPRDAAGNPLYIILTGREREQYTRKLKDLEAGWRATSDPWVLAEAVTLTHFYRQTLPAWLDEAIWFLADGLRSKAHAKRAREAHIRLSRYMAVRDAKKLDKLSWPKACEKAEAVLEGSPAAAEADTMWTVYKSVKADLREGRGGQYVMPHRQRRARG
jgi:hypothetical protein